MIELKNFVEISKYAGERFDLVQAAGGNTSVKLKNSEMLIKASHGQWDYDCPRCQRSYNHEKGYLYSKFETIPRKFKVRP